MEPSPAPNEPPKNSQDFIIILYLLIFFLGCFLIRRVFHLLYNVYMKGNDNGNESEVEHENENQNDNDVVGGRDNANVVDRNNDLEIGQAENESSVVQQIDGFGLRLEAQELDLTNRDAAEDELSSQQRECIICTDDALIEEGLECDQCHSFICDECFKGCNLAHQLSTEYRGKFINNQNRLVCMGCENSFSERIIVNHLDDHGIALYRKTHDEVKENFIIDQKEIEFKTRLAQLRHELDRETEDSSPMKDRVARHRLHIQEQILTLKCSQCQTAIFDFDGCFAVGCTICDGHFCGWCLQDFGKGNVGNRATHAHVKHCPAAPAHRRGGYFGTIEEFNELHAFRRLQEVWYYLQVKVTEEAEKRAVVEAIKGDLRDVLKVT